MLFVLQRQGDDLVVAGAKVVDVDVETRLSEKCEGGRRVMGMCNRATFPSVNPEDCGG